MWNFLKIIFEEWFAYQFLKFADINNCSAHFVDTPSVEERHPSCKIWGKSWKILCSRKPLAPWPQPSLPQSSFQGLKVRYYLYARARSHFSPGVEVTWCVEKSLSKRLPGSTPPLGSAPAIPKIATVSRSAGVCTGLGRCSSLTCGLRYLSLVYPEQLLH